MHLKSEWMKLRIDLMIITSAYKEKYSLNQQMNKMEILKYMKQEIIKIHFNWKSFLKGFEFRLIILYKRMNAHVSFQIPLGNFFFLCRNKSISTKQII